MQRHRTRAILFYGLGVRLGGKVETFARVFAFYRVLYVLHIDSDLRVGVPSSSDFKE